MEPQQPQQNPPQPTFNPAPQEPFVPQQPQIPTPPEGKKSHKKTIIMIVVIMLLLLVLGVVGFVVASNRFIKEVNDDANTSTNSNQVSKDTIGTYVSKYLSTLSSENPDFTATSDEIEAIPLYDNENSYFFTVPGQKGWSFTLEKPDSSQTKVNQPFDKLTSLMEADGFIAYTGKTYEDEWTGDSAEAKSRHYQQSGIVCQARVFDPRVFLACVNESDLAAESKRILPFYTAYFTDPDNQITHENKEAIIISVSEDRIETVSKCPEYQRVNGGITSNGFGAAIGFYRKDNGEWQFEAAKQDLQECKEYDSLDMQKAFHDIECWQRVGNEQVQSTVGKVYGT
jgi:hypothetical protein